MDITRARIIRVANEQVDEADHRRLRRQVAHVGGPLVLVSDARQFDIASGAGGEPFDGPFDITRGRWFNYDISAIDEPKVDERIIQKRVRRRGDANSARSRISGRADTMVQEIVTREAIGQREFVGCRESLMQAMKYGIGRSHDWISHSN